MTIDPDIACIVGVGAGQLIGMLTGLALWTGPCISVIIASLVTWAAGAFVGGTMFGIVAGIAAKAGLGKADA
jgi:hypothetical protein